MIQCEKVFEENVKYIGYGVSKIVYGFGLDSESLPLSTANLNLEFTY